MKSMSKALKLYYFLCNHDAWESTWWGLSYQKVSDEGSKQGRKEKKQAQTYW